MTRLEGGGGLLRLGHEVQESGEHVPPFPILSAAPRTSSAQSRFSTRAGGTDGCVKETCARTFQRVEVSGLLSRLNGVSRSLM